MAEPGRGDGRTPSWVITDAVNEQYGYDLFSESVGEAVIAALSAAGYSLWRQITPEEEALDDW